MGKADEAVASLEKGVLISPDNAVMRNALGSAYKTLGKYREALEEYNRAVALDPNLAIVYYNMGNLFEERGMIPEAIENFSKYIEIYPAGKDADSVKKRIEILEESKKIKKAGSFYKK